MKRVLIIWLACLSISGVAVGAPVQHAIHCDRWVGSL